MNESNVVPISDAVAPKAPMFTFVNPELLHDIWTWVRPRLERVIEKTGEKGWIPEDIYHAVRSGAAAMATIGQDDGIIVMQKQSRFYGTVLFVWVLEGDNLDEIQRECFDEARGIARAMGAKKIIQHSPRKGWERVGFKATHMIYEMEA